METLDQNADVTVIQIEADGLAMLRPHGWTGASLRPGDRVEVEAHPPRNPARRAVLGRAITKEDGSILLPNPDLILGHPGTSVVPRPELVRVASAQTSDGASGIAGIWLPRWKDAFFAMTVENWPLTEHGERYMNAPVSAQNPLVDCVPYSAPRIMVIPVRTELEVLPDRVMIRVDWPNVERVVYTDAREHPVDGERTIQGHATGRWEGSTLVMDTTLFSQDAMSASGLPSGPLKHLQEKLSLGADGKTLNYEFVLEDPEYLLEPVTGVGIWDYRPDLEPSNVVCDLEAARRFLEPVDGERESFPREP